MAENENDKTISTHDSVYRGDTTFVSSVSGQQHEFVSGDVIDGSYTLLDHLGQGGMGSVFSCRHIALGKDYAIKLMHGDSMSAEQWDRFQAEAKALAQLNHPAIVGVHNMGVDSGQFPYLVMDLLSGESLDKMVAQTGTLPQDQALDYYIEVADALSSAHTKGIIHRDVKPANIMVLRNSQGRITSVKLVDFGIARLSKQGYGNQSQTATGRVFGTPFYMSPEQCQGHHVDERSDIYSLGCSLFETLTGKPPFQGENSFQTFMMHQTKMPPRLNQVKPKGNFSDALERAIAKMLAKAPEDRYQKMSQVSHDLERIRAGKTVMATSLRDEQSDHRPERSRDNSDNNSHDNSHYNSDFEPPVSNPSMTVLMFGGIAFALVLLVACAYGVYTITSASKTTGKLQYESDLGVFHEFGDLDTFHRIKAETPYLERRLKSYRASPAAMSPLKLTTPPGFNFPANFIIGALQINHDKPVLAVGFIPVPEGSKVTLILNKYIDQWPEFTKKIGPFDVNGLELRTNHPSRVMQEVAGWKALEELCFFNSWLKAVQDSDINKDKDKDNEAGSDESKINDQDLKELDKLSDLKGIGLCGIHVSGGAIVRMRLFKTISSLKLKRIKDVETVINALPERDNIRELWLVAQGTDDRQIEKLTQMKNLESLCIRRGRYSIAAIESFKKMKSLKNLTLDKAFSAEEKAVLERDLPYHYEPITDPNYWKFVPEKDIEKENP